MTSQEFAQELKNNFAFNEPIFTEEILKVFSNYSRAQVFRYVDVAKENNVLVQYDTGVYFIPYMTFLGIPSTITAGMAAEKKYVKNGDKRYGIYSGIRLLNEFHVTTQMAAVPTIVTNKESSKKRMIVIKNMRFILKKSRCKITPDNYIAYTILELFNEIDLDEKISKYTIDTIVGFMKDHKLEILTLSKLAKYFPSKAIKNMMRSGVLYEFVREQR